MAKLWRRHISTSQYPRWRTAIITTPQMWHAPSRLLADFRRVCLRYRKANSIDLHFQGCASLLIQTNYVIGWNLKSARFEKNASNPKNRYLQVQNLTP